MIDGLVSGKLFGAASNRTGQSGKAFVIAKVRAASGDGEALFVNVIAFSESAGAALLALSDGDSVALSGTLTPKVWVNREGEAKPALDMVAAAVLTAYHVRRKRQTVQGDHHDASGSHQDYVCSPILGSVQGDHHDASGSHTSPTLHQPMDGAEQARQFYGAGFDDMPDDLRG